MKKNILINSIRPVSLENLWKGLKISEEDIQKSRRDAWRESRKQRKSSVGKYNRK